MSDSTFILRGAELEVNAITLKRAGQRVEPTPALPTVQATEALAGDRVEPAALYDKGFEDGFNRAMQDAKRELQDRAESRAAELVQKAVADAQGQMQERTRRLQEALAKQRDLLAGLTKNLHLEWPLLMENAEEDMLVLAFEVVCRVFGEQAASLEGLRALLKNSLSAWHGSHPLSVHLHPDDLGLLENDEASRSMLALAGFRGDAGSLRWVADPQVELGGCLLRASEGALDARLEVQLDALKAVLLQTRAARRHGPVFTASTAKA